MEHKWYGVPSEPAVDGWEVRFARSKPGEACTPFSDTDTLFKVIGRSESAAAWQVCHKGEAVLRSLVVWLPEGWHHGIRDEFIRTWDRATKGLKLAVDYVRASFRIPVSRLLPYVSLVVPISIFFDETKGRQPNRRQQKLLSDFFWRAGWSERYSSAADTRLAQDKRVILEILGGRQPRLDWAIPVDKDRLIDQRFTASSAFSKTVLALLAGLQPRKFNNGDLVNLQNDHMHQANSLNFHHVFPKAYLRGEGYEEWEANRLVNVSLVDDFKNKVLIRARPPSDYMTEFWENFEGDDDFEEIMGTHLIEA